MKNKKSLANSDKGPSKFIKDVRDYTDETDFIIIFSHYTISLLCFLIISLRRLNSSIDIGSCPLCSVIFE